MTLDELKALERAATPGPWRCWDDDFFAGVVAGHRPTTGYRGADFTETICGGDSYEGYFNGPDADFIAAARNMLPRLIAVAEAARLFVSETKVGGYVGELQTALAALEAP